MLWSIITTLERYRGIIGDAHACMGGTMHTLLHTPMGTLATIPVQPAQRKNLVILDSLFKQTARFLRASKIHAKWGSRASIRAGLKPAHIYI